MDILLRYLASSLYVFALFIFTAAHFPDRIQGPVRGWLHRAFMVAVFPWVALLALPWRAWRDKLSELWND